jgi:hypothetical protein
MPMMPFLGSTVSRLLDLEHAIGDAGSSAPSYAHSHYIIQPSVLLSRRFVNRSYAEIVSNRIDRRRCVAIAPQREEFRRNDQTPGIIRVDDRTVVRLKAGPDVKDGSPVGSDDQPVTTTGQHSTFQPRTVELSARNVHDASFMRRRTHLERRLEIEADVVEEFVPEFVHGALPPHGGARGQPYRLLVTNIIGLNRDTPDGGS